MAEESEWFKELNDIQLSLKAEGILPIKENFIDEYGKHCTRFTLPKEPPVYEVPELKPYKAWIFGLETSSNEIIIKVNRKRKNFKFNFNN